MREAEGMIRTWKMYVEEKLNAVMVDWEEESPCFALEKIAHRVTFLENSVICTLTMGRT